MVKAPGETAEAASSLRRYADRKRLPVSWIIWHRAGNPPRYVSDRLDITREQFRKAWHMIKAKSALGGADRSGSS